MGIDRLFVYGTLKPGQSRWSVVASYVEPGEPILDAEVNGQLWATPWDWPALTLGIGSVPGVLLALRPDLVAEALARLDEIEGVGSGLFKRVAVTTRCGVLCWVYLWPSGTKGFTPVDFWASNSPE